LCAGVACDPDQHCEVQGGAGTCVPNTCGMLNCSATEVCEITANGPLCKDKPFTSERMEKRLVKGKDVEQGTLKIRVQFSGIYSKDSISYLLQKFTFKDNKWTKTSDMGLIKTIATVQTHKYAMLEFGNGIVNNIAMYTYN